ncbi:MAG TPA: hypothetical protein VJ805_02385 [Nitrospiraceae bacterium]|nr:hypothetical protein [Nitrospiraceae bacterium]
MLSTGGRRFLSFFIPFLLCIHSAAVVSADTQIIEAQASYVMDDAETPLFAEAMVLQQAKQTALKQAVNYVAEFARAKGLHLSIEEIQAVTGTGIRIDVAERSRKLVDNGLRFFVKIKASLTTDGMEDLAHRIKGKPHSLSQEYKQLQDDYAALTRDVEMLKQSSSKAGTAQDRAQQQDRLREKELALARMQKRESALFERLLKGEDLHAKAEQQLAEEQERLKKKTTTVSTLVDEIAHHGHDITIGEPEVKARIEDKGQADLYFPVAITGNPAMRGKIKEALTSSGGELNNATYRKFERRLANLWFVLEVRLKDGDRRVCYVPTPMTKFQADGEFVSMEEGRSNWKVRMSLPLPTIKEIAGVQGRFMEAMPGTACGIARAR